MKHFFIFLFLIITFHGFGQSFSLPSIPDTLNTPESRATFLVQHYWDQYPFGQSTKRSELSVEQALVNYIDLFRLVPIDHAKASLYATMLQAAKEKRTLFLFYNLFEKYLYDLTSPMRDERLFVPVLEAFLTSPLLKEEDKFRPTYLLETVKKNQIGTKASDFSITFRDGTQQRLLQLPPYTMILYFYDPDCDECLQLTQTLQKDTDINFLINQKQLQIVAIYTGEDTIYWKKTYTHIPENWLCGYDNKLAILNSELYALPGFPTLYLLNPERIIVCKDATFEELKLKIASEGVTKSK